MFDASQARQVLKHIEATLPTIGANLTPGMFAAQLMTAATTIMATAGVTETIAGAAGRSIGSQRQLRNAAPRNRSSGSTQPAATGGNRRTTLTPDKTGGVVLLTVADNPNFTNADIAVKTGLGSQQIGSVTGSTRSSLLSQGYITGAAETGWRVTAKGHALIQQWDAKGLLKNYRKAA